MKTQILKGKPLADDIRAQIRADIPTLPSLPCLAAVCVGSDPATEYYMASQARSAAGLGITYAPHNLSPNTTQTELNLLLAALSQDAAVDGIILLTPLPSHLSLKEARGQIASARDVEGVTPLSIGFLAHGLSGPVPPTARAAYLLARHHLGSLTGVDAAVIGYSDTVGKPLSLMLLNDRATVTVARSKVRDIQGVIENADLLFSCIGIANYIRGEWLRPGTVVIDIGTNEIPARATDGSDTTVWVGDVDFESALGIASAITPVPGGVGTVTTAVLFENLILCKKASQENLKKHPSAIQHL